jgi:hypothetical protein
MKKNYAAVRENTTTILKCPAAGAGLDPLKQSLLPLS